ncbi:MAG: hypothetical protein AAFQ01_00115, partial [Bacteroidota bacterium]
IELILLQKTPQEDIISCLIGSTPKQVGLIPEEDIGNKRIFKYDEKTKKLTEIKELTEIDENVYPTLAKRILSLSIDSKVNVSETLLRKALHYDHKYYQP